MTYMSNSGCSGSYSGCGSGCSSGGSGYSSDSACSGSYSTIDSIVSSYSGSSMNTMETGASADYTRDAPLPVIEMNSNMEVLNAGPVDYKKENAAGKGYNMPYNNGYRMSNGPKQDDFSPSAFLKSERPKAQFIGSVEEIKDYVQEAFKATTGKGLPEDISIEVISQDELKQRHEIFNAREGMSRWNPEIQGFSINRRGFGQSLIFVKENDLDLLMMVIGHEIGHVVNFQLNSRLDEEAKAFAFEMAWVKALYEKDIAGLKNSINPDPKPAKNGLHDVAFGFVRKLLLLGKDAFDVFNDLMKRKISVEVPEYGM